MKCRLIREMQHESGKPLPIGHLIDHPHAHRLVGMGVAIPDDEECRVKCNLTPSTLNELQAAYEMTDRGIHPDDLDAYHRGWMVGYRRVKDKPQTDLLGNTSNIWKHGPKWKENTAMLEQAVNDAESDGGEDDEDGESPNVG